MMMIHRQQLLRVLRSFVPFAAGLLSLASAGAQDAALSNADCMLCHAELSVERDGRALDISIDPEKFTQSTHGALGMSCVDCHADVTALPHDEIKLGRVDCSACHDEVVQLFAGSVHGALFQAGSPDALQCYDCHNVHRDAPANGDMLAQKRLAIMERCTTCHENPEIARKYSIAIDNPAFHYRNSVHGRALLKQGNLKAAACQDCHGFHEILNGNQPRSTVYRGNISNTCGNCHNAIKADYQRSVHGAAFATGISESPVCTTCHGEHEILEHLNPDSPVYPVRLAKEVCGRCHDSLVINRKYGLAAGQVQSFLESYHGLASRLGDTTVANCASCHGSHLILPQSDPQSSIHPQNLQATCGVCHPGASEKFVSSLVHVSTRGGESLILVWIRRAYLALIAFSIGGMLLHNLLILLRHLIDKYRSHREANYVTRFSTRLVVQHFLLGVSFIVLVVTGFSLSYPETIFVQLLSNYLGWGESLRANMHRVAGVVLITTMTVHVLGAILTRGGRGELQRIMLRFQDLRDMFHNLGFVLGVTKTRPRFGRFDYTEKIEYWALLWGTAVMALTGLLMWFPIQLSALLGFSKIWIDAATVIHFYEAWLATLAILIWHFFFVIFHPDEFPMSMTMVTGKISLEQMEEKHPLELAEREQQH